MRDKAPCEITKMILTHAKALQPSLEKLSEPPPSYKQNSPSIDCSKLAIQMNKNIISTTSSINGSYSVKTDDDATKSLLSLENLKLISPKRPSKKMDETFPSTLKDIMKNQQYGSNKYLKESKPEQNRETLNKKRPLDVQNSENFEITSKIEKPENNQAKPVIENRKVQIEVPQLEIENRAQIKKSTERNRNQMKHKFSRERIIALEKIETREFFFEKGIIEEEIPIIKEENIYSKKMERLIDREETAEKKIYKEIIFISHLYNNAHNKII